MSPSTGNLQSTTVAFLLTVGCPPTHLHSTPEVTTTWAFPEAIVERGIMPVAASPRCLTTISPLALRPLVATLTSLVAPAPNPRCRRLCNLALVSTEAMKTTWGPLLTSRVAIACRMLTTIMMLAPDIERTDFDDELHPLRSHQHTTYPLQGGASNPVLSFLIGRTTWNNTSSLSRESLSVRYPYFLPLSDKFSFRFCNACVSSAIDGRYVFVRAPSYPGDMRSNSCLCRLHVYISFLNSLDSLSPK